MRALFAIAILGLLLAGRVAAADDGYRVIVHVENDITEIDRTLLRDLYLKKSTRWSDDVAVKPVDLAPTLAARRKFSQDVLGRSVSAVKSYWQQMLFGGRDVPPPELDGDMQVLAYVQKNRGAVGYVSATADVTGVKTVRVK